jgi:5-bromo-4-chloroindolyl phosphate hydrolysis protein
MARRPAPRRRPLWIGGWLLFLLPLPLLLKVVIWLAQGDFGMFLIGVIAVALLLLGASLTRSGLRQAKRRPMSASLPLKSIGGGLVAVGAGVTAMIAGHSLAIGICFGLAALLGFHLTYGFDRRLRLSSNRDVAQALEDAYRKLENLEAAGDSIASRDMRERLARITAWGERILDRIGEDPEDFRRARKFLNVYLDGAQQVTAKFAKAQDEGRTAELEEHLRQLPADTETVCEEQYQHLLDDDLVDLDVQIEALTTRLNREGVY